MKTFKRHRCISLIAACASTLLISAAARADAEPGKLTLSGYIDAAAGEQLIAGHYSAVIEKLVPHMSEFTADEVAASTNLCVAYVAAGELAEAHVACDDAVAMARLEQSEENPPERLAHRDALAIAYANRAVLSKLSGE